MSNEPKLPDFNQFSRWLASRLNEPAIPSEHYDTLHAEARSARDEFIQARQSVRLQRSASAAPRGALEVLQLMAAADKSDASRPPEMTTARGFRVTLAYDEGTGTDVPSICVLVRSPPELIVTVEGETAYLWNGTERFELGQFDAEGKAIGVLPAGIEISLSDFALGKVKLEEPPPATEG
jgi:hypothetical protein